MKEVVIWSGCNQVTLSNISFRFQLSSRLWSFVPIYANQARGVLMNLNVEEIFIKHLVLHFVNYNRKRWKWWEKTDHEAEKIIKIKKRNNSVEVCLARDLYPNQLRLGGRECYTDTQAHMLIILNLFSSETKTVKCIIAAAAWLCKFLSSQNVETECHSAFYYHQRNRTG